VLVIIFSDEPPFITVDPDYYWLEEATTWFNNLKSDWLLPCKSKAAI